MSTRDTAIAGPSSACYESDDDIFSRLYRGCVMVLKTSSSLTAAARAAASAAIFATSCSHGWHRHFTRPCVLALENH
jgi:hypothetical protein